MKLNLDESLSQGIRKTYTTEQVEQAPAHLRPLLAIPGVKSLFQAADFIAIDRRPSSDWKSILAAVSEIFNHEGDAIQAVSSIEETAYGEVNVLLQSFRGIPMQIRVRYGSEEVRLAMQERFSQAVYRAAGSSFITERVLSELGCRYGELKDIASEVITELEAAYDAERLEGLVDRAIAQGPQADAEARPARERQLTLAAVHSALEKPDWQSRYAALEQLKPTPEALPLLAQAVRDDNVSVRRLATVYLGDVRVPEAMPHLFAALKDRSAAVRRTAGDTLSDIGDASAIQPMCEALRDANKLVRWRAARFLYEVGDETALPALHIAADDAEFEVSLQAKMAIKRIESGEEAAGAVWQQMTNRNRE
jgi:HEAT repeat protein